MYEKQKLMSEKAPYIVILVRISDSAFLTIMSYLGIIWISFIQYFFLVKAIKETFYLMANVYLIALTKKILRRANEMISQDN